MSNPSVVAEPRGAAVAVADGPVGRRERKKRATWLSLHEAAMELSVEKGFEHVTVEEICDRADVSVRTFFNYFPCKEDAVLGGTAGFDDLADAVRARPPEESPLEALRAVYLEKCRTLGDRAGWIRTRSRLVEQHEQLRARELSRNAQFESALADVIAERVGVDGDRDPYPALVAAVALSVLRTSFRRWQSDAAHLSLATLVDRGFTAVLDGLPAPPPRARRSHPRPTTRDDS